MGFRVWRGGEEIKIGKVHDSLDEARKFARWWLEADDAHRVVIKEEETGKKIETILDRCGMFKHSIESSSGDWRDNIIEFTNKDGENVEPKFYSDNEESYFHSNYKKADNVYVRK